VRPDVVHLNQFAFGALPFNAPTVVVAHSCVYSWWRAVHGCAPPATWARYEQTLIHALAACDRVAAPTHAMLQSLRENYGYSGNGIVVPNGRTAEHFVIGPKAAVIFTAGRLWDDAKNLRALEAIAPQLPWPVVVAGATDHPDGSFRQTQGVVALGELTGAAMKRELSRAAIYALPARYEPFGLSALEAALAGCALVLGDIPSLREVWGPAALYVQPDDHAALHAALSLLIRDSAQRRSYAKAARARAVKFTPQRMAKAYVALYEAACAREALARGGQRDSLTRPENSTCAS
jgi:glycosyltransferase involved in cell wall biosynthesis